MRIAMPLKSQSLPGISGARLLARLAVLVVAVGCARMVAGQTPAAPAPAATNSAAAAHKPIHARAHAAKGKAKAGVPAPQAAAPAPVKAPEPQMPVWPANEKPDEASVSWDSYGLRIQAYNSSLQQILKDVSAATGAKVEGLGGDERIFGAYGPGQARDVLSQLLQGTGYNVIMVGDQGQGAPRQIVLSSRRSADQQPGAFQARQQQQQSSDDDADTDDQPAPPPMRPGFGPGAPPRTPQQINQEMQQRQQQQQQQQQQQNNEPLPR